MKILITGAAGFIGYHASLKFCKKKYSVVGLDNINEYYDVNLKKSRLSNLQKLSNFSFYKADIKDEIKINRIFKSEKFDTVIHLAAQAGVQYSIAHPEAYVNSNLLGFYNIINSCVKNKINHLIYASSSSVYGSNKKTPFKESHQCSSPISFYAATKLANEAIAHSYSHIHGIKTTGLRFFTVYGPYGRPDMSPFIFANAISTNGSIKVYNNGKLKRDFTYIDDAVKAIELIVKNKCKVNNLSSIYNIGSNTPVAILDFIKLFEQSLKKKANIKLYPLLKGDVVETYANISAIHNDYNFKPKTPIKKGVKNFIDWYKTYYQTL